MVMKPIPVLSETNPVRIKEEDFDRSRSEDGSTTDESSQQNRAQLWGDPEQVFLDGSNLGPIRASATAMDMAGILREDSLHSRPSYTEYDSFSDGSSHQDRVQLWGDPEQVLLKRSMVGNQVRNGAMTSMAQHNTKGSPLSTKGRAMSITRVTGEHSKTDPQAAVNYIIDKEKRKEKLQMRHKKRLEQSADESITKSVKRKPCPVDHSFYQVGVVYDEIRVPGKPHLVGLRCSGGCEKSIIADDEFEIGILPSERTPIYVCKKCQAHAICYGCWNREQFPNWTKSIFNMYG